MTPLYREAAREPAAADETYVLQRLIARRKQDVRQLWYARVASAAVGLAIGGSFSVVAADAGLWTRLAVAMLAPSILTLAAWGLTATGLTRLDSKVEQFELLRDGLEACRSRSHPGCRKLRQRFWDMMQDVATDVSVRPVVGVTDVSVEDPRANNLSVEERLALVEAVERREAGAVRKAAAVAWTSVAIAAVLLGLLVFGAWSQVRRIRGEVATLEKRSSAHRSSSAPMSRKRTGAGRRRIPRQAGGALDAHRCGSADRRLSTRRAGDRARRRSESHDLVAEGVHPNRRRRRSAVGEEPE